VVNWGVVCLLAATVGQ